MIRRRPGRLRAAPTRIEDVGEAGGRGDTRRNLVAKLCVHRNHIWLRERAERIEDAGVRIGDCGQLTTVECVIAAATVGAGDAGKDRATCGRVDSGIRLRNTVFSAGRELERRRKREPVVLVVQDQRSKVRYAVRNCATSDTAREDVERRERRAWIDLLLRIVPVRIANIASVAAGIDRRAARGVARSSSYAGARATAERYVVVPHLANPLTARSARCRVGIVPRDDLVGSG